MFESASDGFGLNQVLVHGARAAEDQEALSNGGYKKKKNEEKYYKNLTKNCLSHQDVLLNFHPSLCYQSDHQS